MYQGEIKSPDAATYAAAVRLMANSQFLTYPQYREMQSQAPLNGARGDIKQFADTLIRRMRKRLKIPLYAVFFTETSVVIEHCVYGKRLPEKAWAIIGHVGTQIALSGRMPIEWGGDENPPVPDIWHARD